MRTAGLFGYLVGFVGGIVTGVGYGLLGEWVACVMGVLLACVSYFGIERVFTEGRG